MIAKLAITAHLLMCIYIFWSVFIRARWLDDRAHAKIRMVFCVLGAAALLGIAWPIARHWAPDVWSLTMLSSICLVQHVTGAKWCDGVPRQFVCRTRASDQGSSDVAL